MPYINNHIAEFYKRFVSLSAANITSIIPLLVPLAIFSPFFLFGKIFVGNTDMLHLNFPATMRSLEQLRNLEISFWIPEILNGVSLYNSALFPYFYIENLFLIFLPEKLLFLGITLISFLKLYFTGLVAFLIFRQETSNAFWASVCASAYQACGMTIWALTAYDTLSYLLLLTVGLYFASSVTKRHEFQTFFWTTLLGILTLYSTNLIYAIYYPVSLVLVGTLKSLDYKSWKKTSSILVTLVASGIVVYLAAAVRIIPFYFELIESARTSAFSLGLPSLSFNPLSLVRLYLPEIFGVSDDASRSLFKNVFQIAGSIHSKYPQFFSVSIFFTALCLLFVGFGQLKGWVIFLTISVLGAAHGVPILIHLVFFPLDILGIWHPIAFQFIVPYLVILVFSKFPAALQNKSSARRISAFSRYLSLIFTVLTLFVLELYLLSFEEYTLPVQVIIKTSFLVLVIFSFYPREMLEFLGLDFKKSISKQSLEICLKWLLGISVAIFVMAAAVEHALAFILALQLGVIIFTYRLIGIANNSWDEHPSGKPYWRKNGYILFVLTLLTVLIFLPQEDTQRTTFNTTESFIICLLSTIKLIFVLIAINKIFTPAVNNPVNQKLIIASLGMLVVVEGVSNSRINSNIIMNPFTKYSQPLEHNNTLNASIKDLDLKNYRINYPVNSQNSEILRSIYGQNEVCSSVNIVGKIPSYNGYFNSIPQRFSDFLKQWGEPEAQVSNICVYGSASNTKMLGILGVRYTFDPNHKTVKEIKTAIPRLSLFSDYQVLPKSEILSAMTGNNFNYSNLVYVEGFDKGRSTENPSEYPHNVVPYQSLSSDHLSFDLNLTSEKFLLFNESFNSGWRIYINGIETDLRHANYYAMGAFIPRGSHRVDLVYTPKHFQLSLLITLTTLAISLALALGTFLIVHFRIKKN